MRWGFFCDELHASRAYIPSTITMEDNRNITDGIKSKRYSLHTYFVYLVMSNEKEVWFSQFEQNGTQKLVWTFLITLLMRTQRTQYTCLPHLMCYGRRLQLKNRDAFRSFIILWLVDQCKLTGIYQAESHEASHSLQTSYITILHMFRMSYNDAIRVSHLSSCVILYTVKGDQGGHIDHVCMEGKELHTFLLPLVD